MISSIISRVVILLFGTLYPAYASYKAVRTKNLKEYVKWMMYWIVFALFTCAETFTDVFLSWFPFYYEVKIVLVLWLLSPATKGSSILYRKFVHPALSRREQEIDDAIAKAKEQGYHTVLNLGSKGVNYATAVIMQTAIRNLNLSQEQLDEKRPKRRAIEHDVPDSPIYTECYQSQDDGPKVIEIDSDPDFEPGLFDDDFKPTTSRSRVNVARKRRNAKEKRARSNSSGRVTRSQAKENNDYLLSE